MAYGLLCLLKQAKHECACPISLRKLIEQQYVDFIMNNYPSERSVKRKVKEIKKQNNVSIHEAYEIYSQKENQSDWRTFKRILDEHWQSKAPLPKPTNDFIDDPEVDLTNEEFDDLSNEKCELSENKKLLLVRNKKQLSKLGIEYSVFEPTPTGFKKSILDATQAVRTHFEIESFHTYETQLQGPDNKAVKTAILLDAHNKINSKVSLYRPKTKKGDPRMWFRKLSQIADAWDQVAIVILDDSAHLLNLTSLDIQDLLNFENPVSLVLNKYSKSKSSYSDILLARLKEIAKEPVIGIKKGDTAIGHVLETVLGIEANSSKKPDFHGIELKSGRGGKTRTTLFAQVADWKQSPCKKSAEILDKYGYDRDGDFKLYCTISSQRVNTRGLHFKYNKSNDTLEEWYKDDELVAVWPGKLLRSRLAEKHKETFWIEADTELNKDGTETFLFKKVLHTRRPILSQLMPLIESGVVTMDHLIKRNATNGRISEKGPLFKIDKRNLNLLFPEPVRYVLG